MHYAVAWSDRIIWNQMDQSLLGSYIHVDIALGTRSDLCSFRLPKKENRVHASKSIHSQRNMLAGLLPIRSSVDYLRALHTAIPSFSVIEYEFKMT